MTGGRGRLPALLFLAIVLIAIVALLAGYGVPVGIGALVGLVLGAIAGALGSLWLARGAGRSINLGGVAWSSYQFGDTPDVALDAFAEMRDLTEVLGVDLGPTRSLVPVLATVEAGGLAVELMAVEIHEAGAAMSFDVRLLPGALPLSPIVQVSVTDDIGTRYQASGQGQGGSPSRTRYEVIVIPALPRAARELSVRIDRFVDAFPGAHRISAGPWSFNVPLPADLG